MNITKLQFVSGYVDWDDGCIQKFVADFKIVADGKEYEGLAGYYGVHAEEMQEDCFEIHWEGVLPENEELMIDVIEAAFDRFVCIRVECVPLSLEEAIQAAEDAAYDKSGSFGDWSDQEDQE